MITQKSHEEVLKWLKELYGVNVVAVINRTYCIISEKGTWYTLFDNGGEYDCVPINNNGLFFSAEYACQPAVTAGTVAHRIYCVMHGKPIDYSFTIDLGELVEIEEWDYNDVEDES